MRNQHGANRFQEHLRKGAVLVWFAILVFALLPIVALVVHTGMVTLARRQMQTAVNSAAVEGFRFRDIETIDQRRQRTSDLVQDLFDDDFDLTSDTRHFGAGPQLSLTQGVQIGASDFHASRRLQIPASRSYKPQPRLNLADNNPAGDLVAGTYNASAASHSEGNDESDPDFPYDRGDFSAVSLTDASNGNFDAFLVRLRRSGETFSGDVGTSGPPVPFLFGRGLFGGTEFMSRRERGTIVRATAIAHQHRVKAVGSRFLAVPGVSPFAIQRIYWDRPPLEPAWTQVTLWIQDTGVISSDPDGDDEVGHMIRSTSLAEAAVAGRDADSSC